MDLETTTPAAGLETPATQTETPDTGPSETDLPEPEVIAATPKPAEAAKDGQASSEVPAVPAADAYTPNTKFKAMKEEKEFEDWVKPLVNKDNESKVRELHEKAYALEPIKAERDQIRLENNEVKRQFAEFHNEVNRLGSLSQKDLGHFFDELKIDKAKVFDWVRQQLEIEELPEQQKRVYYENERLKREQYQNSLETTSASQAYVDQITQARVNDLTNTLSEPSIAGHVSAFDTRLGRQGAFADMVIRHAKSEWDISQGKKDLSAKDAVNEVLNILGMNANPSQPVPTPSQGVIPKGPATTQSPTVIPAVKPTVIPNVGSGSSSASIKIPKSIDDLRKIAKELGG